MLPQSIDSSCLFLKRETGSQSLEFGVEIMAFKLDTLII